jgi:alkylation response protein AidB-like acyl-CoA dehydrogenase
MDFDLTEVQVSWRARGESLARELAIDAAPADVVGNAARVGLLDPNVDLLALALTVDAMAFESPSAALTLAVHTTAAHALAGGDQCLMLLRGEVVGAVALSSDDVPVASDGRLTGRAVWVAPATDRGIAVVGARTGDEVTAWAVALDAPTVRVQPLETAALSGFLCAHIRCDDTPATRAGATIPIMARLRVLVAAAGLGMGRRALREALAAAKRTRAASAWEETVQGLLADAATELDAAMMLTWKAASTNTPSLGDASLAKLASSTAAQHAVDRSTQVVGADAFQRGHIVERFSQDVRALELFAGRTEALREAAAAELFPRGR